MEQTEKNWNLADKQIALTKGGTLNLTILTLDGYGVQIQSRGVNVLLNTSIGWKYEMTPAEFPRKDEFYSIYWNEYNAVKNGGIIDMVNMVNTAVNNNIYAGRKSGSKYNQSQTFQRKEVLEIPDVAAVNKYANVQEIYEALKCNVSCRGYEQGQDEIAEKEIQNDEPEISNDSSEKMTVWYQGVPLEEWALTDPKYTDSETGISWYIRDGKYPYMVGEDAEKFRKLCEESGEFALKKFAEMTGSIQKLDDNTVAYVGDNGIAVKSKDGKEMFVDTSGLSYDIVMDMFRNLPRNGDFFSNKYWSDNIQKAQARS